MELEPSDLFKARVRQFKRWLLERPESVLAFVSHWGVLHALTGYSFDNCEVRGWLGFRVSRVCDF